MRQSFTILALVMLLFVVSGCNDNPVLPAPEPAGPTPSGPNDPLVPNPIKPSPIIHVLTCTPTAESTADFQFIKVSKSNDGWQLTFDNVQEKAVAIQSLTIIVPTQEIPKTAVAKITTATQNVECWRKPEAGRFEGCTSLINYQIKGNEEFSLLFSKIDTAPDIPSWRINVGYKLDEPPRQTKDVNGNNIVYFPTYESEVECG